MDEACVHGDCSLQVERGTAELASVLCRCSVETGDGVAEMVPPLAGAGLPCACAGTKLQRRRRRRRRRRNENTRWDRIKCSSPWAVPQKSVYLQSCPCLYCITLRKLRGSLVQMQKPPGSVKTARFAGSIKNRPVRAVFSGSIAQTVFEVNRAAVVSGSGF